jgi:hypothetical protein
MVAELAAEVGLVRADCSMGGLCDRCSGYNTADLYSSEDMPSDLNPDDSEGYGKDCDQVG